MTIEEAKAKLSKAYYLIEEVSDAIGHDLTGDHIDVVTICESLNRITLYVSCAKEHIDFLKENDHD